MNTLNRGISLMAQRVKRLPAMLETRVRSLGWEDPLKKEMATHSSILTWKIPWIEEPGRLQSMGSQRVWHDWATSLTLKSKNIPHHHHCPAKQAKKLSKTYDEIDLKYHLFSLNTCIQFSQGIIFNQLWFGGLVANSCPALETSWTVARQAPLSMGFPRQEYWSGLPFPSPGDLPNSGIEPRSPALQVDSGTAVVNL